MCDNNKVEIEETEIKEWTETIDEVSKCPICLDPVTESEDVDFPCKHQCHLDCFSMCRKLECPICMNPVVETGKLKPEIIEEIKKRTEQDEKEKQEQERIASERHAAMLNNMNINIINIGNIINIDLNQRENDNNSEEENDENDAINPLMRFLRFIAGMNQEPLIRGTERWDYIYSRAQQIIQVGMEHTDNLDEISRVVLSFLKNVFGYDEQILSELIQEALLDVMGID